MIENPLTPPPFHSCFEQQRLAIPIDTLKAARRLHEGNAFNEKQAERIAEVLSDLDVASATKGHLEETERRLRTGVEAIEDRLRRQLTTRIYGAAAFVTAVIGILNYVMG